MLDGSRCGKTYKTNLRTHHLELTTPRTMPTRRIKDIYRVCYINLPHGNLLFASLSSPFISLLLLLSCEVAWGCFYSCGLESFVNFFSSKELRNSDSSSSLMSLSSSSANSFDHLPDKRVNPGKRKKMHSL